MLAALSWSGRRLRVTRESAASPDHGLFVAYLALLLVLPWPLGGNHAWAWGLLGAWITVLALLWLWSWQRGRLDLPPAWRRAQTVLLLLALFLGWSALQLLPLPWLSDAALSLDVDRSTAMLLRSIGYLCLFALTLVLVRGRRRMRAVLLVLVVGGVIQAAYGSLMALSGLDYGFLVHKDAYRGLATGTFVNRNHLAGYLEMTLAAGIGLMLGAGGGHPGYGYRGLWAGLVRAIAGGKAVLRMAVVVMVIGLILTHSRMGNTAFMASLLLGATLWLLAARGRARVGAVWFLGSVLAIDVLLIGQWFGFEQVVARLSDTTLSHETRDDAFRYGLDYLRDHWLVGSGGGSFYGVFPAYQGAFIGYYDHAHNDYLEVLGEYGLPGLLLLAGTVLLAVVQAVRVLFSPADGLTRGVALAGLLGVFALMVHGWLDFNLQIPANAATFMVMLALPFVAAAHQRQGDCTPVGRGGNG